MWRISFIFSRCGVWSFFLAGKYDIPINYFYKNHRSSSWIKNSVKQKQKKRYLMWMHCYWFQPHLILNKYHIIRDRNDNNISWHLFTWCCNLNLWKWTKFNSKCMLIAITVCMCECVCQQNLSSDGWKSNTKFFVWISVNFKVKFYR